MTLNLFILNFVSLGKNSLTSKKVISTGERLQILTYSVLKGVFFSVQHLKKNGKYIFIKLLDDLRELFAVEHLAGDLLLPVLTNYVYHCWDSNYIYEKRVQKNTGKGHVSVNKSQVNIPYKGGWRMSQSLSEFITIRSDFLFNSHLTKNVWCCKWRFYKRMRRTFHFNPNFLK